MIYSVKVRQGREMGSSLGQATSANLEDRIAAGVVALRAGGVVAFPTDTLYGLGADIACPTAVQSIVSMKARPMGMGLPLLLSNIEDLEQVADEVAEWVWHLARQFWPGPLTLVVRRSNLVPDVVTGGRDTVAVRVPDHPVPRQLAGDLGRPLTGTSANLTGQPPAKTAAEVRQQLGTIVDLIIEGDPRPTGRESTILDVTGAVPRLLRPGAVNTQILQEHLTALGKPLAAS